MSSTSLRRSRAPRSRSRASARSAPSAHAPASRFARPTKRSDAARAGQRQRGEGRQRRHYHRRHLRTFPRPVPPAPRSALIWRAQVYGAGAEIDNTGTGAVSYAGRVNIEARVLRPTTSARVVSTPSSRAGLFDGGKRHHGQRRWQGQDLRARPAPTAPARPHAEESETQAKSGVEIDFNCYGDVVTVLAGGCKACIGAGHVLECA